MSELTIEYIDFDVITRWPRNPKDHDSPAIQRSITRFGFTSPVIVDEKSGKLVAGHGRLESLRRLKRDRRPCPKGIKKSKGKWLVPVVRGVSFDSEGEAEAYLLVDNKLVEVGGWQEDILAEILGDMDDSLKEYTGFYEDEIDKILKEVSPESSTTENKTVEKTTPKAEVCQEKWKVKKGDILEVGPHIIICADCRETNWNLPQRAHGVFTSPPYGKQREKQYGGVDMDTYPDWFFLVQNNVKECIRPDAHFFINIKAGVAQKGKYKDERHTYVHRLVLKMIDEWKWRYVDEFVWVRPNPPKQVVRRFKNFFEHILWFNQTLDFQWYPQSVMVESSSPLEGKRDKPVEWRNTRWGEVHGESASRVPQSSRRRGYAYPSNVLQISGGKNYGHPAPFPIRLPEFFMKSMSKKGDIWFDPFCGSGTSIEAAENTGRVCYGVEVQPKYIAVTLERMKHLNPRRVVDGNPS
jgi:site-specific DNA-methyltransferase (adenine-specific)/site-specific DNA-methyltransferase (cytosine-N4-specific)